MKQESVGSKTHKEENKNYFPFQKLFLNLLLLLIRVYSYLISPFTPPSCRFYPSCSDYTSLVLIRFGLIKGLWLSLKRLLKCQPFHSGGVDPVPEVFKFLGHHPNHHHG